ncbi:MAG: fibronectin type III domain-containing protein [Bacteroidia bacterium]|nr:fibronectin type III domain-containing protein [Bacteroidia bacterium]MDW8159425.1 fibronectin type III domain-containing protein [Bacteroidia bacterium]
MKAQIYYVDGGWGGPYNGTQTEPWKLIQDAVNNAPDNSTVVINAGAYDFVNYNVSKNLTFISSNGTVIINGLSLNAGGKTLTLVNNFTIVGSLSLVNGKINTTNANLITMQSPVVGSNANSYIIGSFSISAPAGTQTLFFPLGTPSDYLPITLNGVFSSTPLLYTAQIVQNPATTLSTSYVGGLNYVSPIRYYEIQVSGTLNSINSVTLGYGGGDLALDPSNLRIVQLQGSNWQNIGPGSGGANNTITSNGSINTVSPLRFALANANGGNNFCNTSLGVSSNAVCDNANPNPPNNFTTIISIKGTPPSSSTFAWSCDGCVSTTIATNTTGPHTVSWANSGTKTIQLTLTSGICSGYTTTTLVTVHPTPIVTASILSSTSICLANSISNNSVNLSASGSILPGATYTWDCDNCLNGPLGSLSSYSNISWVTNGPKTIKLTIQNPGIPSCVSKTIQEIVTVNALPSANFSVSSNSTCLNQSITLSAQAVGITTYSWNCGGCTPSPTTAVETVSWSSVGQKNITLQVVDNNNCTSPAFNTTITVNSLAVPDPVAAIEVCQGGGILLDAYTQNTPAPNTTYQWSGPAGFTSTLRNPSINNATAANAGFYTVIVSSPGCSSLSAIVQVVVNQPINNLSISSNSPVCVNATINLTANINVASGMQFQWQGPNGFASTTSAPVVSAPGQLIANTYTYSLVVQVPGCPPAFGFANVVVNQDPGGLLVSAPQTVCRGSNVTLTASPLLPVNNLSYLWQGPNNFTSTQQNPTIANISTSASGTYSVTPIVPGCPNLTPSTTTITVSELPASISASSNSSVNAPVCAGQTVQFTATPTVANGIYTWQGPAGYSAIQQNPSLFNASAFNAGIYTLTLTVPGCANSVSTTTTIGVLDPNGVVVGSNSPVCSGGQLQLTASELPGVSYQWNGPNNIFSSVRNPVFGNVSTLFSGLYNLTVTATACGLTASKFISVTVNESPQTPIITASKNPLCEGDSLILSAAGTNPNTFYAWAGPDNYFDFVQNPKLLEVTTANAGTYSVTAYLNGCSRTATTSIQVNAKFPSTFNISSNSPICSGNTLSLSASTLKGANYNWLGPNNFSSTQQNPIIFNVESEASGIYSLTVTIPGCGSQFYFTDVTVINTPRPPIPTSNSPLCEGNTLVLSAVATPGCIYSWVGPNGFSASTASATLTNVTTAASGTYTIVVSNTGCPAQSSTVNVEVYEQPVAIANSNSPVCEGGVLIFTANRVPGATYRWQGPSNFNVAQQNPIRFDATTAMSGQYLLTIRQVGCQDAVATVDVTVSPAPPAIFPTSNSPVCTGSTLILNMPQILGLSYSWIGPNGFSSNSANPSIPNITTAAAGEYEVVVSSLGCSPQSASVDVVVIEGPNTVQVSSNSPLCAGSNLELTATEVPNARYTWRGPRNFSANGANAIRTNVTTADAGVYTLTVQVPGCTEATFLIPVIINTLPAGFSPRNSSPICYGDFLRLTSININGASYEWSGPNGFSSTQPSPIIELATEANSGQYSVTITIPGCSSISGTTNAIVYPPLNTITISSNSPVCQGQQLSLSATFIPGATYQWQGPAGFRASGIPISLPIISQNQAGTYSLTLTLVGCTTLQFTTNVFVNSIAAGFSPTSNSPVCEGRTLILSAPLLSGVTYQWQGPSGFTSTQANPIISIASTANTGIYSLTITDPLCGSGTGTVEVIVDRDPGALRVSSNSPVCAGNSLSLSVTSAPSGSYQWSGPNGFSATGSTIEITNISTNAAGVYTVSLNAGGCGVRTTTTSVSVIPQAGPLTIQSNSPICGGQTLLFTAPNLPGALYRWSGPGGFSSTLVNPTIANASLANNGVYSLTVITTCAELTANTSVLVRPGVGNISAGNNSPICAGNTLVLTVTGSSEGTYLWQGPNGFTSTLPNPIISNATTASSGIYTVTLQSAFCGSASATTVVVVNPSIEEIRATNNGPACAGATINLVATNISGASYSWRGPNGFTAEGSSVTINNITENQAGAYNVSVLLAGCGLITRTTMVVVNPALGNITASNTGPGCIGGEVQLRAPLLPGANYRWQGPGGFTATGLNPIISNLTTASAGTYTVTVTSSCGTASATTSVSILDDIPPIAATNNSPICEGETINLGVTPVAGATYQWQGPNGFNSTLQYPSIPNASSIHVGVYSVIVRYPSCPNNQRTATTRVRVLQGSPVDFVSGPMPERVCQGNEVNFEIRFEGNPPYILTYAQENEPPISVQVNTSPYVLRVLPQGLGIKNYTFGCPGITKSVEVVQGVQLSLLRQTPAGCTGLGSLSVVGFGNNGPFVYSINPSVAPPNTSGVFDNIGAGTYEITATDRIGCRATSSFSVEGISSPIPVVETVTMRSVTLRWIPLPEAQSYIVEYRVVGSNEGFLRTAAVSTASVVVEPLSPSTLYEFRVVAVCANGVQGLPSASTTAQTQGEDAAGICQTPLLYAPQVGPNGVRFSWRPNLSGAACYILSYGRLSENPENWIQFLVPHPGSSIFVTGIPAGPQYGVRVRTNCTICSYNSGQITEWSPIIRFSISSNRQSVDNLAESLEERLSNLKIYPNPSAGVFSVEFESQVNDPITLSIIDFSGRVIYSQNLETRVGLNQWHLSMEHISSGVYMLQVEQRKETQKTRIVFK